MVFREVCLLAMKLYNNMGGGQISYTSLVAQIRAFIDFSKGYDSKYILGIDNVFTWWKYCNPVRWKEHYIQQLAIKVLSIIPHNVGCERLFSILGWMMNK